MLEILIAIVGIFLTIFFVVGVHEFGHFFVARLLGVKVLRFSIGFGKAFYRFHDKKGTEYVFAPIPLGGYVKMLDEGEGTVATTDLPFAYNRQPAYKKLAIVLAGPFFNILFAFVIYWSLYIIGFNTIIPVIGKVTPQSIAAQAGLLPGQEIIAVNDKTTASWMSVIISFLSHAGDRDILSLTTKNLDSLQTQNFKLDLSKWKMNDLKPDPLESLGIAPYEPEMPAIVGKVESPYSNGTRDQLIKGDQIVAVNNKPIKNWIELTEIIEKNPDTQLLMTVKRNPGEKTLQLNVKTHSTRNLLFKKRGLLGISAEFQWPKKYLRHNQYGPIDALLHAQREVNNLLYLNIFSVGKILTGKISFSSLGGPITIFESASAALNNGFISFVSFLAFLSIAIGFINILPIPGLDGGHILFQTLELVTQRSVPLRYQYFLYRLGFIFLLILITQALVNDILRF